MDTREYLAFSIARSWQEKVTCYYHKVNNLIVIVINQKSHRVILMFVKFLNFPSEGREI